MMNSGLVYDDHFLDHTTGIGHPERPDRLRAVMVGIEEAGLMDRLRRIAAKPATQEQIAWVHEARYIQRVFELCAEGQPYIDTVDCPICRDSFDAAALAVGGMFAACDAVVTSQVRNAFCAVRPPGHHAEHAGAMGFCLFNNIALAAEYLIRAYGMQRIAIVDFDVHHCNGTQHTFEERSDVLVISLHEHPGYLYPGTGYAHEKGKGKGEGYTLNLPMMPGSKDETYCQAFEQEILPALTKFKPQIILTSAGFDAVIDDPLAHIELSVEMFATMTTYLTRAADELCQGRLISVLEGGYNLASLARCAATHVQALVEATSQTAETDSA
jgi:acetoin utilization deacetylase AcuC-like enzyme